jgi:hypothetical protein
MSGEELPDQSALAVLALQPSFSCRNRRILTIVISLRDLGKTRHLLMSRGNRIYRLL